jgi:hypothetical protein
MKPLVFHFYLFEDCVGPDGKTLDYKKIGALEPLDAIRARPEAVLKVHLQHLGFQISRELPDLEGKTLDVDLEFHGGDGEPKAPVLVALRDGRPVARRAVRLETLDMAPFFSALVRRKPHLAQARLAFTVSEEQEGGVP